MTWPLAFIPPVLLGTAAMLSVASPVLAAPPVPPGLARPGTPDPQALEVAKAESAKAYRAKRYADAKALGERAYLAGGGSDALETVAVAALQLGQVAVAHACYQAIAHDPEASGPLITRARAQVAALEKQTGIVRMAVEGEPADLQIDGAGVGRSPISHDLRVFPGNHDVTARFADGRQETRTLRVVQGQVAVATFRQPVAAPPPVAVAPPAEPPVPAAPQPSGGPKLLTRVTATHIELDERFHFKTDEAEILPPSRPLLDDIVRTLREKPELRRVRIEGHTDKRGNEDDNLWLSRARAYSVLKELVDRGVERERLDAIGFGAARPVAAGNAPEDDARNRRVELVVVEVGLPPPAPVIEPEPGPRPVIYVPPVKPPPRRAPNVPVGVQHLSDGLTPPLEAGMSQDELRRVAVLPFEALDSDAANRDLGRITSEMLSSRLKARPRILQVERARLDALIGEIRRGEDGQVQPRSAAQVGRLLGADTVLIGSLGVVGPDYLVAARAVDAETGQIIAAFDQAINREGFIAFAEDAVEVKTPWNAAARSAVLPGWGQLYNDEPIKGIVVGSTFAGLALTAGVSAYLANDARDDYFDTARAAETVNRRDEGNEHVTRANWSLIGMGLVWAIGVADAYLNGKDARTVRPDVVDAEMSEVSR